MRRIMGLALVAVMFGVLLGGCTFPWPQPTPEPPPPQPGPPAPEPVLGILMEGEHLPSQWKPLPYGHYWEGQYITFSLVAENIDVKLVEWWIWPLDRPDLTRHYEGPSVRDYFLGHGCTDPSPREYSVLCRVTDANGELHDVTDGFWIHKPHGL